MLRAQALTIERNGLGVPVYTGAPVPDGARSERRAWQEVREGGRAGCREGLPGR
jgi:hypothetical protein